jgi:hypothetical protein
MNPRLAALASYLFCGMVVSALNAYGLSVSPDPAAERWRDAATRRPILASVVFTISIPFWPVSLAYATWQFTRRRRGK